uniref:Structural maintenance of chromosomes protein 5 n=1 Tax=Syphacia muris TaxID=451379 RepID=A0A0N5AAN6_9BILA
MANKQALADSSEQMKEKIGLSSVIKSKMSEDEKKKWKILLAEFEKVGAPNDRTELKNLLNAESARLLAMHEEGDRKAIDRYHKLSDDNFNLKKQLENSSEQVGVWENEIDGLLNNWILALEELIKNINVNFAEFFRQLGCVGEVCLNKPSNPRDISSYGIDIMVKFRNSDHLRRLTHKKQSGGERSVSTMLYLLAMQELCPVPFRCVDEINQGMDPNNEKMVFEMMVRLLSGAGNLSKTQYFLLTPKLLPGLHYGEKSVIHCIYNGVTFPKKLENLE